MNAQAKQDLVISMLVEPAYRHLRLEGRLSDEGLLQQLQALWALPEYAFDRNELYDLSGITVTEVSARGIRQVAALDQGLFSSAPERRAAILAEPGVSFGMARMLQAWVDDDDANLQVFADRDAAVAWLCADG